MKIKKIEWINLGPYGNKKQVLDFGEESNFYHIFGSNGAGKSTLSFIISFGLYGKVGDKNLGDIVNRINGNGWVKINFESNSKKDIIIERGIAPSILNLYIDGIKYDQAGKSNIQSYIEDEIIGIPYYVFNNTISLSINDFKSFIKMSPDDKRKIIDKIFGFHILNQMRDMLKTQTKKIKEEISIINTKIDSTNITIERSTKEMDDLSKIILEEAKQKTKSLNETLNQFIGLQKIHAEKSNEINAEEKKLNEALSKLNTLFIQAGSKKKEIEERLKVYSLGKCPTCQSDLSSEFHIGLKESLLEEGEKIENEINRIITEINNLKKIISDFQIRKNDLNEKGVKIRDRIFLTKKEISDTKDTNNDKQIESLNKIIDQLKEDKSNLLASSLEKDNKNLWYKKLEEIVGDKGVKQLAIKSILPSLNNEIAELLDEMNLEQRVVFDEEFKAIVYHLGANISIKTLSTGEMKKIDFVVLISIIKLMKLKFNKINLLFLDELFSSVDPDGVQNILNILQKTSKDTKLNIFVINHAPMPHEVFDKKINIKKINNFSHIEIENT